MKRLQEKVRNFKRLPGYLFLIVMLAIGLFALYDGMASKAEDKPISVHVEGHGDYSGSGNENALNISKKTQLSAENYPENVSGNAIRWEISNSDVIRLQNYEQTVSGTSITGNSCNIIPVKTSTEAVELSLFVDGETSAKVRIQITVSFEISVDNEAIFMKEINGEKAIVLSSDSTNSSTGLSIDLEETSNLDWKYTDTNVVTGSSINKNKVLVSSVGPGNTKVSVTDGTHTSTIMVYVVPRVTQINGVTFNAGNENRVETGAKITTNAQFSTGSSFLITDRVQWVITSYDGSDYKLVDKNSISVRLKPYDLNVYGDEDKNSLEFSAPIGSYVIYLFPAGINNIQEIYGEENFNKTEFEHDFGGLCTSLKINVELKEGTYDVNLTLEDQFNLADALNTTNSYLLKYYDVDYEMSDNSDRNKYVSYNSRTTTFKAIGTTDNKSVDISIKKKGTNTSVATYRLHITESVLLNLKRIQIAVGQSMELKTYLTNYPYEFIWKSSDEAFVTVNEDGVITGVQKTPKDEDVTITLSYKMNDGRTKIATCAVSVIETLDKIELLPSDVSMRVGDKYAKTIKINNTDGVQADNLTWHCSDVSVVDLKWERGSKSAVVTGIEAGTAVVTVLNEDNYILGFCRVTVVSEINSISFAQKEITANKKDGSIRLTPIYDPATAQNVQIQWQSSNDKVALVDEGVVMFKSAGQTTITASWCQDPTINAQCTVIVQESATSISMTSAMSMEAGTTDTLPYVLAPSKAVTAVTWQSLNPKVADVNKTTGVISAKKAGTTYIVATTSEGLTAVCCLSVTQKASGIALVDSSITMSVGSTNLLEYKLTPADSTVEIDWRSMDNSVVTVDAAGVITAKSVGETYVIATIAGGYSATCKIKVTQKSTGIALSSSSLVLEAGTQDKLNYALTPANATSVVTWRSTDTNIATVDANGIVAAKKAGSTYVIATCADGYSTVCQVIVTQGATGISLAMTDLTIGVGDSYTMGVTITPADSTNKTVTWNTQNPAIATVTSDGKITGVSVGTTFITAKIASGQIAYLNVTVKSSVKDLALNPTEKKLVVGKSFTIKPVFTPADATNQTVAWKSSNTSVATVSSKGKVTAVKGGTAMITCVAQDGGYTATCTVTVEELVTDVRLNHTSYKLSANQSVKLKATVTSNNASNKKVKWSSSNKKIATVSSTGKVKAKKIGKCTIKAKATDGSGEYATCSIRVIKRVSSLKINKSYLRLVEGKSKQLKTKVSPSSASIKSLKWESSDPNVAIVSSKGKVTAIGAGTAKITAKTKDGSNIKVTCTVVVIKAAPVTAMTVSASDITLVKGTSENMNVTVSPSGTTDSITYHSDNKSVATVSSKGLIKGKRPGTATITATASSGVQVAVTATVVGLNKTSMTLEQYDSDELWVEAISDNVKWSSSNPAVARVNNGTVVARKVGTCTITASVRGVKLSCSVRVVPM